MSRFRPRSCAIGRAVCGRILLIALFLLATRQEAEAQSNGMWIDRFGGEQGLNGSVNAIAVADSGAVYVGGSFTEAGGKVVNHIAKWTGTVWEGLGNGVDGFVNALAIAPSGALYAGGDFIEADGQESRFVARWTGDQWEAVQGIHSFVYALAANDTSLFAGGRFGSIDQGPAHRLARWDGALWQDVGGGVACPCIGEDVALVYALALANEGLYVGGNFLQAGGQPAKNIALWDGSRWHALGTGAGEEDHRVWAIAVSDSGDVYVGGDFTEAGGKEVNHVARWTGTTWEPLGVGVNGIVLALALGEKGDVYAGGQFTEAGGIAASNVARWTGSTWEPLGGGVDLYGTYAIDVHDQDVYVGGNFTQAGGTSAGNLALWHDGSPSGVEAQFPEDHGALRFETVYPNPVVDVGTLVFNLDQPAHVRIDVYNVLGQRAAVLLDSMRPVGAQEVRWRTADLPPGTYIVRLQAGSSVSTRSVALTY